MAKISSVFWRGPWPYWVGAIVLAVLNILVLIVRQQPWGVSSNLEAWSEWMGGKIGLISTRNISGLMLLQSSGTYLNLGVILGAFWSTLAASQARFRPIRHRKFVVSALAGGVLMGYGARIAYGCNIGGLLNGIASSSLTGWIFAAAVIIGAWIGSKLLVKYLL
ncbi:YeeE/YedE thiosulfate transporter family protein [Paradesulfitobacterium ferrireducens]|uniref:YeeE/YedE thiosulfate transporter family protein n=1 Tax=Paradesulfitobacterium ferrireducens TaxID=2816476 RepID=UPI001A8D879B|nr:YeeE/YedE thiosulfate transporter family protein [Paradesulfitobacterium ferrireducens]